MPGAYCLYDRDGRRIDRTLTWTSRRRLGPAPERITPPRDATRVRGPVVFGGLFPKPHFGHVLLEMFARLWAHDAGHADTDVPIVHFTHRQRALDPFEQQLVDAAFAPPAPRLVAIDRPMVLSEVLIPHQAVVLGQPMLPAVLPIYDRIRATLAGPTRPDPRPVFLSRTRLVDPRRRTLGEQRLEDRLRRRGVRIVHPESLPLGEQIRLASDAPTVIGLAGSALHLTIFRALDDARTISIGTRTPFAAQQHVEQLRGAELVHVWAQLPVHPRMPGRRALRIGPARDLLIPPAVERRIAVLV